MFLTLDRHELHLFVLVNGVLVFCFFYYGKFRVYGHKYIFGAESPVSKNNKTKTPSYDASFTFKVAESTLWLFIA